MQSADITLWGSAVNKDTVGDVFIWEGDETGIAWPTGKQTHTHTHTNTGSAMVVVVVEEVGSDVARHCQFKTDGSFVENGALCFT